MHNDIIEPTDFILYDLHSHTIASDGLLTPTELVTRASLMRVGVLAITDHDTTDGLVEAATANQQQNLALKLIYGVEISTVWQQYEIHVVALNIDITHPRICRLLAEQAIKRYHRAKEISHVLEKTQIPDVWLNVTRLAKKSQITRIHFARYLVELGMASNVSQVFKKYLAKDKIGYVPPHWCTITQAINAIHKSGGQAILAHPFSYRLTTKWLKRLLFHFSEQGGDGVEVATCQQTLEERILLGQYAEQYNLLASQGSDFHYPCSWVELGRKLWLPAKVKPIWHDWKVR